LKKNERKMEKQEDDLEINGEKRKIIENK
jgi:hypothetical protein